MTKQDIIFLFPKLVLDNSFKLSSKKNINYNCIAWAASVQNEFWWPEVEPYNLDGVKYNWPFDIVNSDKLIYFIELFHHLGYSQFCSNINNEHPEYRKIALFIKYSNKKTSINNCVCTHAARQLSNGLWTSKLGPQEDIQNSDPYDLEGSHYGKLAVILKKKL